MKPQLPLPGADAIAASRRLCLRLTEEIAAGGGWLSFARFMELALYAPGLGYYSGGAQKFGAAGDFITAPELTPLFAQTLAVQAQQVMALSAPHMLEVGAGSGKLAAELLLELERRGALPASYGILELSGELRARQAATLAALAPHLAARVVWLERLPPHFSGLVLANELLDALPVHVLAWREEGCFERGVVLENDGFAWAERGLSPELAAAAAPLAPAAPFLSEINLAARAWVAEWGRILRQGTLLLIDYGYTRTEYYHAERRLGTLLCHYRQHAHADPFWYPGLNDITAHVDFTAVAEAGFDAGLNVAGYLSQAALLVNCGIAELLARIPPQDAVYAHAAKNLNTLTGPNGMGERFKAIALTRGIEETLIGFARGDRTHTL